MKTLVESAKAAKAASLELARLTTEAKNAALRAMARALMEKSPEILAANEADMQRGREGGMPESLLDRCSWPPESGHSTRRRGCCRAR